MAGYLLRYNKLPDILQFLPLPSGMKHCTFALK
jgi:hypothetical protein